MFFQVKKQCIIYNLLMHDIFPLVSWYCRIFSRFPPPSLTLKGQMLQLCMPLLLAVKCCQMVNWLTAVVDHDYAWCKSAQVLVVFDQKMIHWSTVDTCSLLTTVIWQFIILNHSWPIDHLCSIVVDQGKLSGSQLLEWIWILFYFVVKPLVWVNIFWLVLFWVVFDIQVSSSNRLIKWMLV